jgi:FAD/FMN-containing dehydrogenase
MQRRELLKGLAALPLSALAAGPARDLAVPPGRWVRPGEPGWPDPAAWARLRRRVGGRLVKVTSPFAACTPHPDGPGCDELFQNLGDPFYISDQVALTQTLGWTDAWTSQASAYAVLAQTSADVAAAVTFARTHRVRLVIKGGGHSYLGGSNAPDSLLVWTRPNLGAITLHDRFVPRGGAGHLEPEAAVSVGAGAIWMEVYDVVTTRGGRYVQGGGCTTVGVAGLVLGGGFGSFSKGFGTAAANLLEAEIVTADGAVRIANPVRNRELFWALKGGGGGTFGVATRLTLRTHGLPGFFGAVLATITATSNAAYAALVDQVLWFYHQRLLNRHWGDVIRFGPGRQLAFTMTFQGLTRAQAERVWAPLFAWVTARPADYTLTPPAVLAVPAQDFWNADVLEQGAPGLIVRDDRPGAPEGQFYYAVDADQVGQVLHGYESTWLSRRLLAPDRRPALVAALVRASQIKSVALHCNKGLAGAPPKVRDWTSATAMNPAVLDAFALAIASANEPPAYPGIAGHQPDLAQGRADARVVAAAMAPLQALAERPASYVSETDYFQDDWQAAFWGDHYARLSRVKDRYDPGGLFTVHHGVGTDT